jgi:heat shock protein HtpX|tara:strand:- start:12703 stop:13551 length:849 start_codon:yes stop_codon:yes gene_type:complete
MLMNKIKTFLLLASLSALILAIGGMFGGRTGLTFAFVLAIGINFFSYFFSHKLVLAVYRAKPISKSKAPGIHKMVGEIAKKAGIPKPKIYLIPSETPNAFATGRNPKNAVVAVTVGITKLLNKEELKGVLAHEIGHVKNRDILISTIAATLAAVIMYVSTMARFAMFFGGGRDSQGNSNILQLLVLAIVAPIAAMIIQFAISRSREFMADETSAKLTKQPKHLASALQKLEDYSRRIPLKMGNESTSSLFIINPFTGRKALNLFSTHPTTKDRVARLNSLKF